VDSCTFSSETSKIQTLPPLDALMYLSAKLLDIRHWPICNCCLCGGLDFACQLKHGLWWHAQSVPQCPAGIVLLEMYVRSIGRLSATARGNILSTSIYESACILECTLKVGLSKLQ